MTLATSKFIKSAAVLSVLGLALSACADDNGETEDNGAEADEGGEITISMFAGWEEGIVATHLWEIVLEEEGYDVTIEESEPGVAYAGLANEDYDINLDAWLPVTHESYWDEYGDDLEDFGAWNDEVYLTLAVNDDAPIESLEELADNADEFGNTIYGIEPGAGLTEATEDEVIPTYELEDMDFVTSSTSAMIAELDSHMDDGENVVVTLWRPHWTYGEYDIRDLEDPEGTLGDEEGVNVVARDGFSEDHPEVAEWLENFEMETEMLNDLLSHTFGGDEDGEPRDLVEEWVDENRDYVDGLTD
ncbi:glycine betaine ABC transporter substrate-binding protein [Nesterenkonia populi]|uniref:glycine betaine ABC transporter substrate-binding protein n=1 Tax=Nesterenkonia populi TaxID=1591087 RepID=UPI0011BFA441|nr:glycine betaine ABC transporter substrate-binding protein [Nesterenkonia populi]